MKMILIAMFAVTLAAQTANQLSKDAKQAYSEIKNDILRSAEKMPEENYSFKPAPRVRTFGQILGHIAEEQYMYCSHVKGEQKAVDVERTKISKADLIAALKESFAYCDGAYDSMTDAMATETIKVGDSERTKLRLLWSNTTHDNSHYGNIVTYLRIKGLVPPSTEGQ
jgi:uncharacterized damage-inducible protein DinB